MVVGGDPVRVPQVRVEGGVRQRAVRGERPVGDHHRQVPVARRQIQPVLLLVAEQVEAGQPAPDLRAGEVHPVVVVPQRRGPLLVRVAVVAEAVPDVARLVLVVVGVVVGVVLGQHEVHRVAVVRRRHVAAVQVHHGRPGQPVAVPDGDGLAPAGPEGRSGELAVVAPDLGLHPRQDLHPGGPLHDLVRGPPRGRPGAGLDRRRPEGQREALRQRQRTAQQLGGLLPVGRRAAGHAEQGRGGQGGGAGQEAAAGDHGTALARAPGTRRGSRTTPSAAAPRRGCRPRAAGAGPGCARSPCRSGTRTPGTAPRTPGPTQTRPPASAYSTERAATSRAMAANALPSAPCRPTIG